MKRTSTWGRQWTVDEEETLKEVYPDAPHHEIMRKLPLFSWNQIKGKAHRMGVRRIIFSEGSRKKAWSKHEHHILRTMYSIATRSQIQKHLPTRSWQMILSMANDMGLWRDCSIDFQDVRGPRNAREIEQHHRNMIQKYFGRDALAQHIEAQEQFRRGDINASFPTVL